MERKKSRITSRFQAEQLNKLCYLWKQGILKQQWVDKQLTGILLQWYVYDRLPDWKESGTQCENQNKCREAKICLEAYIPETIANTFFKKMHLSKCNMHP